MTEVELLELAQHYGLPGVIILALGAWIVLKDRQYRDDTDKYVDRLERSERLGRLQLERMTKVHHKQLDAMRKRLTEEQGLRVEDAKSYAQLAIRLQEESITYAASFRDMARETTLQNAVVERIVTAIERPPSRLPR